MKEGTGAGVYGQSVGRRLSIFLGKYDTVFQAERDAILACAYEIQMNVRPEKYARICSDSSSGCQNSVLIGATVPKGVDISTCHTVGLYWVHEHAGVQGNEIAEKLTRDGSVQKFVGPKPSLGGL